MTKHQRKRLYSARTKYLTTDYKHLGDFTIVCAGFSLATLSATKIHSIVNLGIIILLLLSFLIWSLYEMFFNKKNELRLLIKELSDSYKNDKDKVKEIKAFDVWFGSQFSTVKHTSIVTISILFMVYTGVEHLFRLG